MDKPENWLFCAQGIAPACSEQAAKDSARITRHWQADRALLDHAAARPNAAALFDTAMGAFDRMLKP
ncbi:hypothetical protein EOE18_03110 [Novosphingobium umbonatum]|uniref:Uncharacterized protein n=1 Tax=Novosphingobium umbonatum TaxID=1908524 RepID=A0A3S2YA79_9SPHN|nr:hypothetical protein [Novosphingobium umbonatum]RVU06962.1 hypothetical protein EOE18_03110 [Novosphingobium umbonatum]